MGLPSDKKFYRTSSITAFPPAISTVPPRPQVKTARARGETYDTVPRDGSASSSPTMRNVCARPSSLRTVTVMPKDTVRVSEDGLTEDGVVAFIRRTTQGVLHQDDAITQINGGEHSRQDTDIGLAARDD